MLKFKACLKAKFKWVCVTMCSLVMSLFSRGYIKMEMKYQQCFSSFTSVQYSHCAWFLDGRTSILVHVLFSYSTPRARWAFLEKLSGYSRDTCQVFEPAVTIAIGCFYIAVLLFFQSLWEYHAMMSGLAITG